MKNDTQRTYENAYGDLVITDIDGVTLVPWDDVSQLLPYGLRSWATDEVDAAQRAYAEGYALDSISENGRETYVRKGN